MKKIFSFLNTSAKSGRFKARISTFITASKAVAKLEENGFEAKVLKKAESKAKPSFLSVSWENPRDNTLAMELYLLAKEKKSQTLPTS